MRLVTISCLHEHKISFVVCLTVLLVVLRLSMKQVDDKLVDDFTLIMVGFCCNCRCFGII